MENTFGLILFLGAIGAACFVIFKNKAELPDPKEMRETKSNQSRESDDDLGSSLNDSLNQLSNNETKTKREAKKRSEFIRKNYKNIASFYNSYKFIDYSKKANRKIAKKQMLAIVNLDKNLEDMEYYFNERSSQIDSDISEPVDYGIILVGIITFKMMKKETLKKVNLDLKKLYRKGEESEFPVELMAALERVLAPFGNLD